TAAAVESEHQARREALPVRVQVGQATQLGQELVVLPELEANVDLDLDGGEALLLEERPNVCRERFAAQAGERLSTPDGETFRQQTSRLARIPGIHALSRRADEDPKRARASSSGSSSRRYAAPWQETRWRPSTR